MRTTYKFDSGGNWLQFGFVKLWVRKNFTKLLFIKKTMQLNWAKIEKTNKFQQKEPI